MFKIWSPAVGLHGLEANLGTLRPPKNAFGVTLEQKKTKKKKRHRHILDKYWFPKKGISNWTLEAASSMWVCIS